MKIINKSCELKDYMALLNKVSKEAKADKKERYYCLVSDDTMTIFENGKMIGIVNQLIATDDVYIQTVFDTFVFVRSMNPKAPALIISAFGLLQLLAKFVS